MEPYGEDWQAARDAQTARLKPLYDRIGKGWFREISIGKGWEPIVLELDRNLAEVVPDYKIAQVKEKFGGLRYYINGVTPEAHDEVYRLIGKAESLSQETCEECGHAAAIESVGTWWRTLCPDCLEDARVARAKRDAASKLWRELNKT